MAELTNSNWSEAERVYDRQRQELLRSVDLTQYVDDPFLFLRRQRVTDYLTRIKLFEAVLEIPGAIVECGVHKGGSLMLYAHLSSILEPYGFSRKIFGFDTFEGFRSISEKDPGDLTPEMFADTSYDVLQKAITLQDLNRAVSHVPKCELIRGDATKTVPEFVAAHPELVIALLYLDFDLYRPTAVALQHLLPLVPKGGIVVLDELNMRKLAGETTALKERFPIQQLRLRKFPFDPWPSYFVVGE